jgi:hypothetical protein
MPRRIHAKQRLLTTVLPSIRPKSTQPKRSVPPRMDSLDGVGLTVPSPVQAKEIRSIDSDTVTSARMGLFKRPSPSFSTRVVSAAVSTLLGVVWLPVNGAGPQASSMKESAFA